MESLKSQILRAFVETQSVIKPSTVRHSLRTSPPCLQWMLGCLDRAPDLALSLTLLGSETNRSIALYQTWNRRSSPYRGSQTHLPERASVLAYRFNKARLGPHLELYHLKVTLTPKKKESSVLHLVCKTCAALEAFDLLSIALGL